MKNEILLESYKSLLRHHTKMKVDAQIEIELTPIGPNNMKLIYEVKIRNEQNIIDNANVRIDIIQKLIDDLQSEKINWMRKLFKYWEK